MKCVCAETQAGVVHEVSRILHGLVREQGVPAGDVAVLTGSWEDSPLKHDNRIGSFWTTTDQVVGPQKVLLDSVQRFTGLERPVIVLTGIDHLPPDDENALLYVGLSRARVHLAIVAAEATLERLGLRAGSAGRLD